VGLGWKPTAWELGGLKKILTLPYGVRLKQTKLQVEALPPSNYKFSTLFAPTCRFLRQIRRPMSSKLSYNQLKFLGFQNLPHSRGTSRPWTSDTSTPAPLMRLTISALYFVYSRRCLFHAQDGMVPCHLSKAKPRPVLGYFESSPPFFTPGVAQASKASAPRDRVLTLQANRPSSPIGLQLRARGKKT
jgi:hypothetical protein